MRDYKETKNKAYMKIGWQVREQVWGHAYKQVDGQVWEQVYKQVWEQVGGQVRRQIYIYLIRDSLKRYK